MSNEQKGIPPLLNWIGLLILALLVIAVAFAVFGCRSVRDDIVSRNEYISVLEDYCRAVDSVGHFRETVRQQQHVIDSLLHL